MVVVVGQQITDMDNVYKHKRQETCEITLSLTKIMRTMHLFTY